MGPLEVGHVDRADAFAGGGGIEVLGARDWLV